MASKIVTCSKSQFASDLESLRDRSIKPTKVRQLVSELTKSIVEDAITAPDADEKLAIIVILRSGMAMSDSFVSQLPADADVSIYHLGLFRDKTSLQPVEYYNKLPAKDPKIKHAYVLDPVLATGGTVTAAINILKDWGVPRVTVVNILASKVGLAAASGVWPESTDFIVGAIDPEVDAKGHIQPGIGDIGDRLYGTGA
ncbi:unnamed protein product [Clonostachys rhizophaga]|uniref:uracil phosphoribosyltransferase n=1 Tax=Clonostachys rhizophaga TaxID=160324 RepID=A0A9N9YTH8_9HYPO|nr:unnamed protein product [Clonostachys rhizophaga]